jgi:hypothetical protein
MNLKELLLETMPVSKTGETHYSKGAGSLGEVLVIDDNNPVIKVIAKALSIPDGWKLRQVESDSKVPLYAAYNSGDRLVFFTRKEDFEEDDE